MAGHLVAAGVLIDEDPALALEHARTARALGARLAIVREAAGLTAYAAGEYREAAAELRAYRRMSGSPEHLAVLADCERALGRPERALAMLEDPDVPSLPADATMELLIVASGARRDLGDADAAVAVLEIAELDSPTVRPWTARLWYAYADALLHAGRREEAVGWFTAVAAIDDDETDAAERLTGLGSDTGEQSDIVGEFDSIELTPNAVTHEGERDAESAPGSDVVAERQESDESAVSE